MSRFEWDINKSERLKRERGIGFEDIEEAIKAGRVLDDIPHPSPERYPGQRLLIVQIDDYAYVVPFVPSETGGFLKTLYASRRMTRRYLEQESDHG